MKVSEEKRWKAKRKESQCESVRGEALEGQKGEKSEVKCPRRSVGSPKGRRVSVKVSEQKRWKAKKKKSQR